MQITRRSFAGWLLIGIGLLIFVFSHKIVFPGLERLVGIEMIVGVENVVYEPDGRYMFTNPAAMAKWIASVAAIGIVIGIGGVRLLIGTFTLSNFFRNRK